jgi:hypothetical protein
LGNSVDEHECYCSEICACLHFVGLAGDGIHKAMNDIRYVCLSDIHLGAENSILTRLTSVSNAIVKLKADPTTASEVMVHLVNCLRLLISQHHGPQKPTLILNGYALELALGHLHGARRGPGCVSLDGVGVGKNTLILMSLLNAYLLRQPH